MKARSISILLFAFMSLSIFLTSMVECGHHCFELEKVCKKKTVQSGALKKYLDSSSNQKSIDSEPIVNNIDVTYMALVNVGNPPQRMKLVVSLLQSDTWIVTTKCNSSTCLAPRPKFNSTTSSTYEFEGVPYSYVYSSISKANGLTAYDDFRINNLKISHFRFAAVNDMIGFDYFFNPESGYLGLGYVSRSPANLPWIIESAYMQETINSKVFALWFNPNENDPRGGELTFGGISRRRYTGKITYAPLTGITTWTLKLDKVDLKLQRNNTMTVCDVEDNCQMRFDPESLYTYGPKQAFDKLNEALGGTYNTQFGVYDFNCSAQSTLPDFVFHINGKAFPIKAKNYIIYEEGYGCYSALIGLWSNNFITGNSLFLLEYYTIFNFDRKLIGIAKAKV